MKRTMGLAMISARSLWPEPWNHTLLLLSFFINVKDNDFLNHSDKSPQGWGYAVFGKVTDGMDIIDEIKGCLTGTTAGHSGRFLWKILLLSQLP